MSTVFYAKSEAGWLKWANVKAIRNYLAQVDGKELVVSIDKETGVRSGPQNSALHVYYEHLATALNEKNLGCKFILGDKTVELDWTPNLIKEMIWRPIQIALTGKTSTTQLDKVSEIDKIYDHLNRLFSNEPFMVHVPFPNDETKNEPTHLERPTENSSDLLNDEIF